MYIYIYIERERERERELGAAPARADAAAQGAGGRPQGGLAGAYNHILWYSISYYIILIVG